MNLRLPIRVHCWGGFGSQLFALVTANRLAKQFPKRGVNLVFHSSGVTERGIELPAHLLFRFRPYFLDDFDKESAAIFDSRRKQRPNPRTIFSRFLSVTGLLAKLNYQDDYLNLKPWIIEVRGHYTRINLTLEEISWLMSNLQILNSNTRDFDKSYLSIHMRLGDLRTLNTKSHISKERLSQVIKSVQSIKSLEIFSDSDHTNVMEVLDSLAHYYQIETFQLSTIDVIRENQRPLNFLGTNSKISLWIAIFRIFNEESNLTLLPRETFRQLLTLTSGMNLSDSFQSY